MAFWAGGALSWPAVACEVGGDFGFGGTPTVRNQLVGGLGIVMYHYLVFIHNVHAFYITGPALAE